jgi:hypothetical protein
MLYIDVLAGCVLIVIVCLVGVMMPPHSRKH